MTKHDISKAIGNVSDAIIIESMEGTSAVTTSDSDEVLYMKPTKRRGVRKIAGMAIAACLVLTVSITAIAAADVKLSDLFKDIFNISAQGQEKALAQLLADDAAPCVSNGTTITPLAAISDSNMCYVSLRVDAPEGTVLSLPEEEDSYLQLVNPDDWADLIVNQKNGKSVYGTSSDTWSDPVPGDNSLNVVISYEAQVGISSFFGSNDIRVSIHNIWKQENNNDYTLFLDGDWTLDLSLQKITPRELNVKGLDVKAFIDGKIVEREDMSITLKSMSISPLSLDVSYGFTSPDAENIIPGPGTVQVVMKDGSAVAARTGNGDDTSSESRTIYVFSAPVDVSDVDYVRFGDQKIHLD